jgi:basic amino acid/polyamine antiporter, APA family
MPPASGHGLLQRRLGTADAVVIGLGAMIGAGVFAAVAPAAEAAGPALLISLGVAAIVAYCNAMSSAWLAARHPESGGTYVYGRARLSPFWGYMAGWGFVAGKLASCAAMALTFGFYAAPEISRPVAVAAVVCLVAVNYRGVQRTAQATRVIVAVVLAVLAATVVATLGGGQASAERLEGMADASVWDVLRAAAFFFFAFAGYARLATLGEEVTDPERTLPRAIPLALAIVLVVYAAVAAGALLAVGADALAASDAPLAVAVAAGELGGLEVVVRLGAAIASLGVLLSLIAGVSRTALAMGRTGDLPGWLAGVHPRHRVPHHAELAVGVVVVALVLTTDLRGAIGFSAFTVLGYYAIANAAAWTLPRGHARGSHAVPVVGIVGCVTLAFTLPTTTVLAGAVMLGIGVVLWVGRHAAGFGGS